MASVHVPINPETLKWARKVGKLHEEELGRAASVPLEKIRAFESGEAKPTYAQMKSIAKKLDRSIPFFFVEPPKTSDIPETVDFRGNQADVSPLVARALKRAEYRRRMIIELEGEGQNLVLPTVKTTNIKEACQAMRKLLGLKPHQTPSVSVGSKTLSYWIELLEKHGVLVFQTTRVPLTDFRGLSVFHESLPIIILNGADSAAGKVFTIFHEVAHLASKTSGLCLLDENVNVEAMCNAFSQEFLMPAASFDLFSKDLDYKQAVNNVSRDYRVSKLAAAVRLRTLKLITEDELSEVRRLSDEEWEATRERFRESEGGPRHHFLCYRDLGGKFVGTVVRALEAERIGILDASYLFSAKIETVDKIVDHYYRKSGGQ